MTGFLGGYSYSDIDEARLIMDRGIRQAISDNPDVTDDDVAPDVVAYVAMDCTTEVGYELCRRELGFIPQDVKRVRPDIAAFGPDAT